MNHEGPDLDCPFVDASLLSARADDRNAHRVEHVSSCPACREAVALDAWLRRVAGAHVAPLPSAAAIRLRGRLRARARTEEQAYLWSSGAFLAAAAAALVATLTSFASLVQPQPGQTEAPAWILGLLLVLVATLLVLPWMSLDGAPTRPSAAAD